MGVKNKTILLLTKICLEQQEIKKELLSQMEDMEEQMKKLQKAMKKLSAKDR